MNLLKNRFQSIRRRRLWTKSYKSDQFATAGLIRRGTPDQVGLLTTTMNLIFGFFPIERAAEELKRHVGGKLKLKRRQQYFKGIAWTESVSERQQRCNCYVYPAFP